MRISLPALTASLLALHSAPASGQTADWCSLEGERIRVHTTTGFTPLGLFMGCADESLVIRPDAGDTSGGRFVDRVVAFGEVEAVDVSRGLERPVLRSLLVGASLVGFAFGGFAWLTGDDGESCLTGYCVRLSRERKAVWGLVGGAILGGGGGLLHGLNQESEVWEPWPEVPLEAGPEVVLGPVLSAAGAVGVGLSVRF